MGTLQKNNTTEAREYLLYMRKDGFSGVRLAYWASVGKGKPGGVPEIRFAGAPSTVLPLQYKFRWRGRRLLQKNIERDRVGRDAETRISPKCICKSLRSLSEIITRIRTYNMNRPKGWRKGQMIFNFLEWLGADKNMPTSQSSRMADPFYLRDEEWDRLWEEYCKEVGITN